VRCLEACHLLDIGFEAVHTYKRFAVEQLATNPRLGRRRGEDDKKMQCVSAMQVVSVEHVHKRIAFKKHPVRLAF
jgi:hypothetical protein